MTKDAKKKLFLDSPSQSHRSAMMHTYDADKREIGKVVDRNTTKYFLDGSNVIADYDGDDTLLATYVTPGLDANLSQERGGSTYYYMADGLGSIRNLVDSNQMR